MPTRLVYSHLCLLSQQSARGRGCLNPECTGTVRDEYSDERLFTQVRASSLVARFLWWQSSATENESQRERERERERESRKNDIGCCTFACCYYTNAHASGSLPPLFPFFAVQLKYFEMLFDESRRR